MQEYAEEAPSLCWGKSPMVPNAVMSDACNEYIFFQRLTKLKELYIAEKSDEYKQVNIYYYETPTTSTSPQINLKSIPQHGIVLQTIKHLANDRGTVVQVRIQLDFLPIEYTL